jgi:hypothetical protein
MSKVKSIG